MPPPEGTPPDLKAWMYAGGELVALQKIQFDLAAQHSPEMARRLVELGACSDLMCLRCTAGCVML